MYEDDDLKIDEFLTKLTSEEYKSVESSKDIDSNFSALDEVLISINAIKLTFSNPELKIDKKIRNKVLVVIPNKAKYSEDDKIISDIKAYKNMYELDIQKTNELIDGIKNNFITFSDSVNALINTIEKSKSEYFETIKIMMIPMTTQKDKLNKIEVKKFNKEKKLNYEDKRMSLDDKIKEYDKSLSKIISEKKEILISVNQNLMAYINLLDQLDGPINSMIDDIENILNSFEEKCKQCINIIMTYTNNQEKQTAIQIFNELKELNKNIISLINDYSLKMIQSRKNIEKQIQGCNNDMENIRQNNMVSSDKLTGLQEDTKSIIKEINDLLRFCWIKTKIPQITKDLKGFQLYDIKLKMEEGTKNIIKANEKLEENFNELKTFVKEKSISK